jgi:hypothetical protein
VWYILKRDGTYVPLRRAVMDARAGQRRQDTRNASKENDESKYTRSVAYTRLCPL